MASPRLLIATFCLAVLGSTSWALDLTPKQQEQLKAAREEMGLKDDEPFKRHICLWDLSGKSGPIFNGATNLRLDLIRYNMDISLEAFTNEGVLAASLKNGHCDAALMSGFRARQFNRFSGTIDAIGALPDLEHMKILLRTLAHPNLDKYMVSNKYQTLAVTPAGAAYLFVDDKRMNSLAQAAGKKVAVLDFDPGQSRLVTHIGAAPVSTTMATAPNLFNNGTVNILPAPLIAYEVLELYKGMDPDGGIVDYPIVQLTAQLIAHTDRFPPAIAALIREVAADSFSSIQTALEREAGEIPAHWWIDVSTSNRQEYDSMMRAARLKLRESGYYDATMLSIMKRIRCNQAPQRPECSQETE
ncbi:MAG: putative solute-binding protein [Pseudomonadota bacterium]|uniref:putative solute-binding protein n=1 Tax=Alcanivorax sp. TaxID=1872427 RepID=UPI0025C5E8B9|nr:putative solute-binding protein [Alcanivorax sp.]MED5238869.1 putative solute-binding protein [Pseudomonadota bacterium]MEE3320002.1 putative solute-binding protein [Pseudomonadota bacterium]